MGAYGNIKITRLIIFLSFLSICSLAISVLYGIWWKMSIANIWFNECPNLIASGYIQSINSAHFYYMIIGVLMIGIIVGVASWEKNWRTCERCAAMKREILAVLSALYLTSSMADENKVFVFDNAVREWSAHTGIVLTSAAQNLVIQSVAIDVSSLLSTGVIPLMQWSGL